jgi:hypothetical protein
MSFERQLHRQVKPRITRMARIKRKGQSPRFAFIRGFRVIRG